MPMIFTRNLFFAAVLFLCACTASNSEKQVKAAILRYNQLLADGYRAMNMNPMQESATIEQATKLYHHMSALGEARLRMDSTLKGISFVKIDRLKPDEATVQTRETWDFSHIDITSGKKFAEERGFIYEMRYDLKRDKDRWVIKNVDTLSGTSTNTIIPWPKSGRTGSVK